MRSTTIRRRRASSHAIPVAVIGRSCRTCRRLPRASPSAGAATLGRLSARALAPRHCSHAKAPGTAGGCNAAAIPPAGRLLTRRPIAVIGRDATAADHPAEAAVARALVAHGRCFSRDPMPAGRRGRRYRHRESDRCRRSECEILHRTVLSKNSCRPHAECRGRAGHSKKFCRGKNKFDVKRAHARRNGDVTRP